MVYGGVRRRTQLLGRHIADDADDRRGLIVLDLLPDRILLAEKSLREVFVDDHHRRRGIVARAEGAPAQQRNAHRAEIVALDDLGVRVPRGLVRSGGTTRNVERRAVRAAGEGWIGDKSHALESGNGAEALEERAIERQACRVGVVARVGEREAHRQQMRRPKARIDGKQARQTPERERRRQQQHERERDLNDDAALQHPLSRGAER